MNDLPGYTIPPETCHKWDKTMRYNVTNEVKLCNYNVTNDVKYWNYNVTNKVK